MSQQYIDRVVRGLEPHLVGQRIKSIGFMDKDSAEDAGWESTTLVIELENGVQLFALRDDEGNDVGALATSVDGYETVGVVQL